MGITSSERYSSSPASRTSFLPLPGPSLPSYVTWEIAAEASISEAQRWKSVRFIEGGTLSYGGCKRALP
jgi:hypothetical protein